MTSTTRWPLAAIIGAGGDSIQLVADSSRRRLVVEIRRAGILSGSIESTEIYWLRGSEVLISLADAGNGSGVQATLSVGGLLVREASPTPNWTTASMASAPTSIRLGGDGVKVRQTPMHWWSGQSDPDRALPKNDRAALLTSLSFLTPPGGRPACGADLDSAVTPLDFLTFQSLFASGDPRADWSREGQPGALDLADILAFIDAYEAGCP